MKEPSCGLVVKYFYFTTACAHAGVVAHIVNHATHRARGGEGTDVEPLNELWVEVVREALEEPKMGVDFSRVLVLDQEKEVNFWVNSLVIAFHNILVRQLI